MLTAPRAARAGRAEEARLDVTADREGFVVVYPDSLAIDPDRPSSFSTTRRFGTPAQGPGLIVNRGPDDVAFLVAVIADLPNRAAVDPRQIFVTGFSNGEAMTFRFAAQEPALSEAIAPVAGYCPFVPPIVQPMPTLFLVGSDDPLIPIAGGDIRSPWDGRIEHRPPLVVSLALGDGARPRSGPATHSTTTVTSAPSSSAKSTVCFAARQSVGWVIIGRGSWQIEAQHRRKAHQPGLHGKRRDLGLLPIQNPVAAGFSRRCIG